MKNGIFFLTYNGYYNFTSGIGAQTNTFLKGIETYYKRFRKIYGEFEINLIVPKFDNTVGGFNQEYIDASDKIINKFGGRAYKCDSSLDIVDSDFWTVANWKRICVSASSIILEEATKYKQSIVIAVDPPFLHVPRYIEEHRKKLSAEIQSVILMYTSSYIHDKKLSYEKLGWEYSGLASTREYENIKIGKICNYMYDHFIKFYGSDSKSFVPYPSSLFLEDDNFNKLPQNKILDILSKYNIPDDKNIIFAFGRMARVKGFDILLKSFRQIQGNVHLVLLATTFEDRVDEYKNIIKKENLSCSLITQFTRELPIALCQYKHCRMVVCPSRSEPFSNIPLEVALWAKDQGPVVLASNVGGFIEQIDNEKNGFIFNIKDNKDLIEKMKFILQLPDKQLKMIRLDAYNKVIKERDFFSNFGLLLNSLWS